MDAPSARPPGRAKHTLVSPRASYGDDVSCADGNDFHPVTGAVIEVTQFHSALAVTVWADADGSGFAALQRECADRGVTDVIEHLETVHRQGRIGVAQHHDYLFCIHF